MLIDYSGGRSKYQMHHLGGEIAFLCARTQKRGGKMMGRGLDCMGGGFNNLHCNS